MTPLQKQTMVLVFTQTLGEDCNGECLADADGDGVCDASEVDGCVDDTACNYDVWPRKMMGLVNFAHVQMEGLKDTDSQLML